MFTYDLFMTQLKGLVKGTNQNLNLIIFTKYVKENLDFMNKFMPATSILQELNCNIFQALNLKISNELYMNYTNYVPISA